MLPPLTVLTLGRNAGGQPVRRNLASAAIISLAAWGLIALTGDYAQWIALGIGTYSAFSWVQVLAARDPAGFAMMFGSRAFIYTMLGFPLISFVSYAFAAWAPPFFIRVYGIGAAEAGLALGFSLAIAGWLGITLGGTISDGLRARTDNGRVLVGLAAIVLATPTAAALLLVENLLAAYVIGANQKVAFFLHRGLTPLPARCLFGPAQRTYAQVKAMTTTPDRHEPRA